MRWPFGSMPLQTSQTNVLLPCTRHRYWLNKNLRQWWCFYAPSQSVWERFEKQFLDTADTLVTKKHFTTILGKNSSTWYLRVHDDCKLPKQSLRRTHYSTTLPWRWLLLGQDTLQSLKSNKKIILAVTMVENHKAFYPLVPPIFCCASFDAALICSGHGVGRQRCEAFR